MEDLKHYITQMIDNDMKDTKWQVYSKNKFLYTSEIEIKLLKTEQILLEENKEEFNKFVKKIVEINVEAQNPCYIYDTKYTRITKNCIIIDVLRKRPSMCIIA